MSGYTNTIGLISAILTMLNAQHLSGAVQHVDTSGIQHNSGIDPTGLTPMAIVTATDIVKCGRTCRLISGCTHATLNSTSSMCSVYASVPPGNILTDQPSLTLWVLGNTYWNVDIECSTNTCPQGNICSQSPGGTVCSTPILPAA